MSEVIYASYVVMLQYASGKQHKQTTTLIFRWNRKVVSVLSRLFPETVSVVVVSECKLEICGEEKWFLVSHHNCWRKVYITHLSVFCSFSPQWRMKRERAARDLWHASHVSVQSDTWLKAADFTFTLKLFSAKWGNRYECDTVKFTVSIITRVCNHNSSERC